MPNLIGVKGTVKSVNIVATTVVTLDNEVIVVPNRQVFGNVITNATASDTRRVDLTFGIGYGDDIPHAISVLKEAVEAHPLVLKTPEPLIVVKELGDSSVNFLCAPWTKAENWFMRKNSSVTSAAAWWPGAVRIRSPKAWI